MDIGRAAPRDYDGILELQAANYRPNLTAQERERGFLSAQFTREQLAAIADDLAILVARDDGRVVAYVCAHRPELAPVPPLIESMLACARAASYRGRALARARFFLYGPVCIDRACRGRGLLRRLYTTLRAEAAADFELGVTLVSADNPHSLRAHIVGLGMDEVGAFEHGRGAFHLLAFDCRLPPVS
jgi:hypothetical protein